VRFLALLLLCACPFLHAADTIAVLPLFNADESQASNLDWIGESVAETIHDSLSSAGLLVLAREDREEVFRRLAIRPAVVLTKASVMRIGENLDAGRVIYGDYKVDGAENGTSTLKSGIRITVHFIDLKRLHESPALEQSGPLENLTQIQTTLAWMCLHQLDPERTPAQDEFTRNHPPVRIDANESYIRGLMSVNPDQRMKLFSQAARLDDHFSQPNFQLGRMLFFRKDYKTAAQWLERVTKSDSHFEEASFLLGICRYQQGDFDAAARKFRAVLADLPLNEVYNDLGAALSRRNDPAAADNFRKALEGDDSDPDYWFNFGYSLWKQGKFAEAAEKFRAALDRSPEDQEATAMLGRCIKMDGPRAGDPRSEGRERIKTAFEDSAWRQLQAELKKKQKN
jgi:tetratricopeptide (TPR) repeat protein